jgi:hypothetical protein
LHQFRNAWRQRRLALLRALGLAGRLGPSRQISVQKGRNEGFDRQHPGQANSLAEQ